MLLKITFFYGCISLNLLVEAAVEILRIGIPAGLHIHDLSLFLLWTDELNVLIREMKCLKPDKATFAPFSVFYLRWNVKLFFLFLEILRVKVKYLPIESDYFVTLLRLSERAFKDAFQINIPNWVCTKFAKYYPQVRNPEKVLQK